MKELISFQPDGTPILEIRGFSYKETNLVSIPFIHMINRIFFDRIKGSRFGVFMSKQPSGDWKSNYDAQVFENLKHSDPKAYKECTYAIKTVEDFLISLRIPVERLPL